MGPIPLTPSERIRIALYTLTANNAMQARADVLVTIIERAGGDLSEYDYNLSADGAALVPKRKET